MQKKLNTTTIFVTHDQVEAMTMGDRIAVMNNGKVEQIGTPIEIYNNPKSRSAKLRIVKNLAQVCALGENCTKISEKKRKNRREKCIKIGKHEFSFFHSPKNLDDFKLNF